MHLQTLSQRYAQGEKDFSRLNLAGADLSGIILAGGDLRGTNFQGANLHGANLSRCRLHAVNFRGARLTMTNLRRANLPKSNLSLCSLVWSDLGGANLQGADLQNVVFDQPRPHLPRWGMILFNLVVVVTIAVLLIYNRWATGLGLLVLGALANLVAMGWRSPTGANLRGADLRGANLTGAQLGGMYLLSSRCEGATLPNGWPYQFWLNFFPWD
ncbi:putative endoribonuclease L-PSP [Gloeomargarita lithophora Alchichica-D10]|uniref:Putative endoribonuclease L-PSP n=1 Tax=Gloeomargarita lithophora Alchichica-D10 TaxID=1188229 RepID=A0A1J0AF17_9CYAN|nr:pentapeptide repeat-containing protein [Gloeomargarita lithophora]APB34517.1 putative endoribonuclease L-PSP [Gloeomargarita lithophora Alchichica-D10]